MNLKTQKNLVSRTLGVSKKRIKLSVNAQTKKDLKELISREGARE
jgi:ribosomal protein L19E